MYPSKVVGIYRLKRTVPGIFGDGIGSGGVYFLPVLKAAPDWKYILSGDANSKSGLCDTLTERLGVIKSQLRGHIDDVFISRLRWPSWQRKYWPLL
jgi:hypothetical protein